MDFARKNNLVVKLTSANHFDSDMKLFKKHFPDHKLNKQLALVNHFSKSHLDGDMLLLLLDIMDDKAIIANRHNKTVEEKVTNKTLDVIHTASKVVNRVKETISKASKAIKKKARARNTRK
jgi:hypothetical protein